MTRTCPGCGAQFEPHVMQQLYCSTPCRKRKRNERQNYAYRDGTAIYGVWSMIVHCLYRGVPHEQIAEMVGVEPNSVRRIEAWTHTYDRDVARGLADCRKHVTRGPQRRKMNAWEREAI
jgi:hypothetical protein